MFKLPGIEHNKNEIKLIEGFIYKNIKSGHLKNLL